MTDTHLLNDYSFNNNNNNDSPEKFMDALEYEDDRTTSFYIHGGASVSGDDDLTATSNGFQSGVKILGDNLRKLLEADRYNINNDNMSVSGYSYSGTTSVYSNASGTPRSTTTTTTAQAPDSLSPTLRRLMQRQKQKYELLLKVQGEEHAKQIEEIIQQLNDIEVKYQVDISKLKESLTEKNKTILSLQTTLEELKHQNIKLVEEASQQHVQSSTLRQDYDTCVEHCKQLEWTLQNSKLDLQNIQAQQERLLTEAIVAAQEEIRIEADRQFASANRMFLQLKKEYADAVEERLVWMKRTEETTTNVTQATQTYQTRMDALNYQLESIKTEYELSKIEHGQLKQQLQSDSTLFNERMEGMRRDVVKMEKECAEAHQLVGTAVREKEKLKREVQELKGVCEELMSMVEVGGKN